MAEQYDFVIIGNSAAGLQAIRTLRKHDNNSTIALIDREDRPAYSRVLTPLLNFIKYSWPPRLILISSSLDNAFTTETPTPWRPPE